MANKKSTSTVKPEQTPAETKPTESTPVVADAPVQKAGSKKPAAEASAQKAGSKKPAAAKKASAKKEVVKSAAVPAVAEAAEPEGDEPVQEGGKRQRYFKCEYNGESFGRYCGLKPKQAANKALTSIIRGNGGNDQCIDKTFKFEMIECTRGGNKKRSVYEGVRTKLPTPLVVNIKSEAGAKTITYKFTNKLKKVKDVDTKQAGGKKTTKKPAKNADAKPAVEEVKPAVVVVEAAKPVTVEEAVKPVVEVAKEVKPAKKAAVAKKAPVKKAAAVKA